MQNTSFGFLKSNTLSFTTLWISERPKNEIDFSIYFLETTRKNVSGDLRIRMVGIEKNAVSFSLKQIYKLCQESKGRRTNFQCFFSIYFSKHFWVYSVRPYGNFSWPFLVCVVPLLHFASKRFHFEDRKPC